MDNATIIEAGNGFPSVGDYVMHTTSGALYRVTAVDNTIHTGDHPGAGNWLRVAVEPADWVDCAYDGVFPAVLELD